MADYFLADDLSGALDAAAAFHRMRQRVAVELGANAMRADERTSVVGITTETRNASAVEATAAVMVALERIASAGGRLIFKKIDSTLRGPVAAELQALLAVRPEARVLFTPANPRAGRTVRDGILRVQGVPVAETEFGRDPVSPVRESCVRTLLGEVVDERVTIADAVAEEDLLAAVDRMDASGRDWIGVGSGALAGALAARRFVTAASREFVVERPDLPAGPILMLCGSAHRVNRTQAETLRRERGVPVFEYPTDESGAAQTLRAVIEKLRAGGGACLLAAEVRGDSEAIREALTAAARHIIPAANVRRLFVTGGETAFAVSRAAGVDSLRVVKEIESGATLAATAWHGRSALVAVKNGAFGDASSWVRGWDALNE